KEKEQSSRTMRRPSASYGSAPRQYRCVPELVLQVSYNSRFKERHAQGQKKTAFEPPCCCLHAATRDSGLLEISATVFETRSGLSFSGKLAWVTILITRSCASSIGIRLL